MELCIYLLNCIITLIVLTIGTVYVLIVVREFIKGILESWS